LCGGLFLSLAAKVVDAIGKTHGMVYDHGDTAQTIYPASGVSSDYAYGKVSEWYHHNILF